MSRVATKPRSRSKPHWSPLAFLEAKDGVKRIDPDAGIIRGVKILGLESSNGRKYLPDAVRKAKALYEGAPVRIDHPKRAGDSRQADDVFGWLRDVRVAEDGCLYGDLHFLKSHDMAARVCEAAERNPRLYGLSHNVACDGDRQGGVDVISEITEVFSVDLVADPATVNGLFEDRTVKTTIKAFLETVSGRLDLAKRQKLKKWMEGDGADCLPQEMEPDADPAEADPGVALKDGFRAAVMPLLDQALDGDAEALKQLVDFVKTHAKIAAKPAEEDDDEEDDSDDGEVEEDESDDAEEDEDDDKKESKKLKSRGKGAVTEARCKSLCKLAGLKPEPALVESLMAIGTPAKVLKHLEYLKTLKPAGKGQKPRSTEQGDGGRKKDATTESKVPDKAEDWGKSLLE